MKKLLLLVSCFAVILILSKVSFAEEAVAADAATCPCEVSSSALPFAYPPYPFHRGFDGRFVARRFAAPQALPLPEPLESPAAAAFPYPYGISDLKSRAVRRAARLTPKPQPYPVAVPVAVAPPVATADSDVGAYAPGPVSQWGKKNYSVQRSGAPVINFLSVVRGPR